MSESPTEQLLLDKYGPYVPIARVWRMLSFSSAESARKAAVRGQLPIECVLLPSRRGRFVRTSDLGRWFDNAARGSAAATQQEIAPTRTRNLENLMT